MRIFEQELAIDLGTANTVIFQNGQKVLDEPSIVALDAKTGNVLAIGSEAKVMDGKVNPGILTVCPLGDGVISDFDAAEKMIIGFVKKNRSGEATHFYSEFEDCCRHSMWQHKSGNPSRERLRRACWR